METETTQEMERQVSPPLKAQWAPLGKEKIKLLAVVTMAETMEHPMPEVPTHQLSFLAQIILKRIEVLKLPITFTTGALLVVDSFTHVAGGAVVLLIDALTKFEGQVVTARMLCDLYPWGFYTEDSLGEYIDDFLKPRKVRWSKVY